MPSEYRPGAHERHLLRRQGSPLFAGPAVTPALLEEARRRDEAERESFLASFHELLQQALALKPQEESEALLELKGRLDQAYTLCVSLGDGMAPFGQGLERLTATVMAAIRRGAGDDPRALQELEQEALARQQHYRLLEQPLVADLMRPDSPLAGEELVPVLLGAGEAELEAALWLFDEAELAGLCDEAHALLEQVMAQGHALDAARANLARMRQRLGRGAARPG